MPCCCIQVWNAARVAGSKVERIWSSWTVGAIWAWGSDPPSRSLRALDDPGESSTYVSPSNVFWRRIARVSAGRGANCGSISITARVSPVCRSRRTLTTLPTSTPEIRTSAWLPRFTAWSNSALIS